MSKAIVGASILSLGFAVGCSGDADSLARPTITAKPVAGCEAESYGPCDVTNAACQAAIFSTATCLRGSKGVKRPKSRTLTQGEYARELTEAIGSEDSSDTLAYEKGFVLLGLAEAGDLSIESRVGVSTTTVPASYNWETQQVTFVVPDTGKPNYGTDSAYIMLVHEYVHALQDQEHNLALLDETYATSTDSALALRSLIEGEAETHENRFLAATWGLDAADLDWDARYRAFKAFSEERLAEIAPVLAIWRSFPYEAGGMWLHDVFESGGMGAVRALYEAPPPACITVTAGIQPIPIDAAAPLPPEGYEQLAVDTLGAELFYFALTKKGTFSPTVANSLAADWRSDRLYMYRNRATGHVIVIWRLRFATEASKGLVLGATAEWRSTAIEGDVMIGLSTDPDANTTIATCFENAKSGVTIPTSAETDGTTEAARLPRWLRRSRSSFLRP